MGKICHQLDAPATTAERRMSMTVTIEKPKIINLLFRQEKSDPDYGSCVWARFYLNTDSYTMLIESDCGNYSYGWCPTPNTESFLHLLCRLDYGYLRDKLAERTVVNGKETWRALRSMIECEGEDLDDYVWKKLEAACYHKHNADEVYYSVAETLEDTPLKDAIEAYSIYQCVEMDYHASVKKIVSVFLSAIVPVLRELEKENAYEKS